jgi:hypothetical protein
MATYRFYQVTAAEQNTDVRWDGFTARREGIAGLGWSFVSMIRARNVKAAEKQFRGRHVFRKTARQNDADPNMVFVLVERIKQSQGIS